MMYMTSQPKPLGFREEAACQHEGMIVTLEKVKRLLGITDTSQDGRIEALISTAEADYLSIRGRAFETDADGGTVYPDGAEGVAAEMVAYKLATLGKMDGIQGETIGSYSYTKDANLDHGYPAGIVGRIRRYGRIH